MLSAYDCEWHWDEGVGHDFPDRWHLAKLEILFLGRPACFCKQLACGVYALRLCNEVAQRVFEPTSMRTYG